MKPIFISDQTLKMLSQEKETPLLFREKTAIASELDALRADRIEMAPIANFQEDRIICTTIASSVKNSVVAIPAGTTEESVCEAWQCISAAQKPCLIIELPVSTLKMEYLFHVKEPGMQSLAQKLVSAAKALCGQVDFFAVDATHADLRFLLDICLCAQTSGATSVTICDEDGEMLPEAFGRLIRSVKETLTIPVYVKCCDLLGLAAAQAASAIRSGADGLICASVGGNGLSTSSASKLLSVKGEELAVSCALDTSRIHTDISEMRALLERSALRKAETADTADSVYLDADSTLPELSIAAEKLGYELTEEDLGNVMKALRQVCERKSTVGTKELEALIASYAMQAPSAYHLDSYLANCGNKTASIARVALLKDGQLISGVSDGDGPIDASFRAIEQTIGYHYELDDFQIQSVTEGKEALGAALVKLRSNGKLYSGNGISTDIVGASIRAYLNALNKIVYEENGK